MRLRSILFAGFLIFIFLWGASLAQAHTVSLSWTASTDAGVSYNVYRFSGACPSTGTAGFSKINTTSVAATTYTDASLAAGTYCYYATSVLNGAESVPSNLAPAVLLPAAPTALSATGTS